MSQFFASGGQSIGVSASASVLPMNISGLILDSGQIRGTQGSDLVKETFLVAQPDKEQNPVVLPGTKAFL